jgi:hypothetical protein
MIFLAAADRTGILMHGKETGTKASVRHDTAGGSDSTWISKIKIEHGKSVPGSCRARMCSLWPMGSGDLFGWCECHSMGS